VIFHARMEPATTSTRPRRSSRRARGTCRRDLPGSNGLAIVLVLGVTQGAEGHPLLGSHHTPNLAPCIDAHNRGLPAPGPSFSALSIAGTEPALCHENLTASGSCTNSRLRRRPALEPRPSRRIGALCKCLITAVLETRPRPSALAACWGSGGASALKQRRTMYFVPSIRTLGHEALQAQRVAAGYVGRSAGARSGPSDRCGGGAVVNGAHVGSR
jgi:hypothetical protein